MAKHIVHVFLLVFCLTNKNENKLSEFVGQLVLGLFCAEHHRFYWWLYQTHLPCTVWIHSLILCFKSSAQAIGPRSWAKWEKRLTLTKIAKSIIIVVILLSQYLNMELK